MRTIVLAAAIVAVAVPSFAGSDWTQGSVAQAELAQKTAESRHCAPDLQEVMYKQLWALQDQLAELGPDTAYRKQRIKTVVGQTRDVANEHVASGQSVVPDVSKMSDEMIVTLFLNGGRIQLTNQYASTHQGHGYITGEEVRNDTLAIEANAANKPVLEERIKELKAAIARRGR